MQSISDLKEQTVTDTPLLLFDCVLADGQTQNWSTHGVTAGDTTYAARVLQHSSFDIQTASDQGVDGSPRISIVLANADSYFSEIERSVGFKGATLTVRFVFYDLVGRTPLTDATVLFQGICNPPDQITESTFRLTAANRMNLQRLLLPTVRVQRHCPWSFPTSADQRAEAVSGGPNGRYSLFYNCGYSPDMTGGAGVLNGSGPFTSCGYTRQDCQARGMWKRFGGLEFVPPGIAVRSYGKNWSLSAVSVNQAQYNDFVPMVYGAGWYEPMVVFARNDGNLTRMQVLLGMGPMQGVLTVLVNGIEIPLGVAGKNMTATGWYNVLSLGSRDGNFDLNFTDAAGQPAGDPYGSMAYLSVVTPNAISNGNSLPTVKVLAQGLMTPVYSADGGFLSDQFSSNPAWILLDILRRSGWAESELDLGSFAAAAAYCDEQINSTDLDGNAIVLPRFACNLILQTRRSAGDVIRGIRNTARLYLTYGPGGVLQLTVENAIALQQPSQTAGGNSVEALNGGWPVYEFGDGSNGFSGILRNASGAPSVKVRSRAISDTPNCLTVEFQDALNGYQQDSYTVVNVDDVARAGQQVTTTLMALGMPNYDQAARILRFNLDKSISANTYIDFATSVKGFGIRPGDLITVTYLKEGFNRQPFRVLRISPATNYRTATITAQIHDDAWYTDANGQGPRSSSGSAGLAGIGTPRPLVGREVDSNGMVQFAIEPNGNPSSSDLEVSVSFTPPQKPSPSTIRAPQLDLLPQVQAGGSLAGSEVLYYAVSGVEGDGNEGPLSFIVQAVVQSDKSSVQISGLRFSPTATGFNVYRGTTPAELLRIASAQPLATDFIDTGLQPQLSGPPDANFDHANFYWRREVQPEIAATIFSSTSIGNGALEMNPNSYRGMIVRITRGAGAGEEQAIAANDATTITLSSCWVVAPDDTSFFAIAEAAWHFAALSSSSPVQFTIPRQSGEVVQVTGRAANVNDVESAAGLAIVTRYQIDVEIDEDAGVPAAPSFGLQAAPNGGSIVLSGISFADLTNTKSISSATLTLHYRDELATGSGALLSAEIGPEDGALTLDVPDSAATGSILQIDGELVQVTAISNDRQRYSIARAIQGTTRAPHAQGTAVYRLLSTTAVATFPREFFGSPYGGDWNYVVALPDARVASAELFVTNEIGNSPVTIVPFTQGAGYGLRSLSGGQYSIQVDGCLAVDQSAAPAIVVETAHAVRDVSAILGAPADGAVQLQLNVNGAAYCTLTIPSGQTTSNTIDGAALGPLPTGGRVTLSILQAGASVPGSDLTLSIRL